MQVVEAYYPETKFTEMKWLSYEMEIFTLGATASLAEQCNEVLNGSTLEVLKNTKSGEKIVDIRPLVRSASVVYSDGALKINCTLSSDPSCFLNPEYVIDALKDKVGILSAPDLTSESYTIKRIAAYFDDMTPFR